MNGIEKIVRRPLRIVSVREREEGGAFDVSVEGDGRFGLARVATSTFAPRGAVYPAGRLSGGESLRLSRFSLALLS